MEITAEVDLTQERSREPLPEPRPPCLPPGLSFGTDLGFLGASFHLYLAEVSFLFLRKDWLDVSGGPLDSRSCWPQTCQEKPGVGEGQLAIWGGFVLINSLQPKEFLGLTLLSDYKYL